MVYHNFLYWNGAFWVSLFGSHVGRPSVSKYPSWLPTLPQTQYQNGSEAQMKKPQIWSYGLLGFELHSKVNRKFLTWCWMCCSRMFAYYVAANVADLCPTLCLGFEVARALTHLDQVPTWWFQRNMSILIIQIVGWSPFDKITQQAVVNSGFIPIFVRILDGYIPVVCWFMNHNEIMEKSSWADALSSCVAELEEPLLPVATNLGSRCLTSKIRPKSTNYDLLQGLVNVPIKHRPTIGDIISNRYLKVMLKIPKKGHLPTTAIWCDYCASSIARLVCWSGVFGSNFRHMCGVDLT